MATSRTTALLEQVRVLPPGGTLKLGPGEYPVTLVVDKPLTILGAGKATVLRAERGQGPVVHVRSTGVILTGLWIEHDDAQSVALRADPGTLPTMRQVILHSGLTDGTFLDEASPVAPATRPGPAGLGPVPPAAARVTGATAPVTPVSAPVSAPDESSWPPAQREAANNYRAGLARITNNQRDRGLVLLRQAMSYDWVYAGKALAEPSLRPLLSAVAEMTIRLREEKRAGLAADAAAPWETSLSAALRDAAFLLAADGETDFALASLGVAITCDPKHALSAVVAAPLARALPEVSRLISDHAASRRANAKQGQVPAGVADLGRALFLAACRLASTDLIASFAALAAAIDCDFSHALGAARDAAFTPQLAALMKMLATLRAARKKPASRGSRIPGEVELGRAFLQIATSLAGQGSKEPSFAALDLALDCDWTLATAALRDASLVIYLGEVTERIGALREARATKGSALSGETDLGNAFFAAARALASVGELRGALGALSVAASCNWSTLVLAIDAAEFAPYFRHFLQHVSALRDWRQRAKLSKPQPAPEPELGNALFAAALARLARGELDLALLALGEAIACDSVHAAGALGDESFQRCFNELDAFLEKIREERLGVYKSAISKELSVVPPALLTEGAGGRIPGELAACAPVAIWRTVQREGERWELPDLLRRMATWEQEQRVFTAFIDDLRNRRLTAYRTTIEAELKALPHALGAAAVAELPSVAAWRTASAEGGSWDFNELVRRESALPAEQAALKKALEEIRQERMVSYHALIAEQLKPLPDGIRPSLAGCPVYVEWQAVLKQGSALPLSELLRRRSAWDDDVRQVAAFVNSLRRQTIESFRQVVRDALARIPPALAETAQEVPVVHGWQSALASCGNWDVHEAVRRFGEVSRDVRAVDSFLLEQRTRHLEAYLSEQSAHYNKVASGARSQAAIARSPIVEIWRDAAAHCSQWDLEKILERQAALKQETALLAAAARSACRKVVLEREVEKDVVIEKGGLFRREKWGKVKEIEKYAEFVNGLDEVFGPHEDFVDIGRGKFVMGSPTVEPDRAPNERRHNVSITRGYELGRTPVTQAWWEKIMKSNPSLKKGPQLPVHNVTWLDAVEFCNRLSAANGLQEAYRISGQDVVWLGLTCPGFRLPTEAEWECACRCDTMNTVYGTFTLKEIGWFEQNSNGTPHPVGTLKPNAWGLFDMLGNVWEWCNDWFADYPGVDPATDPVGPLSGKERVRRGGSWDNGVRATRAASRRGAAPSYKDGVIGFRVARTIDTD